MSENEPPQESAGEGGAPLNLYLELEDGALADMEVVGQVSVAFVSLVREIAFIIDPSIEVKVQLQSGTEGSLSLNTLVADLKDPAKRKATLYAVAIAIGVFFGPDIKSYVVSKVIDTTVDAPSLNDEDKRDVGQIVRDVLKEQSGLTADEQKDVEAIVRRVTQENVARPQRQQIFRELSRDPSIKGVGASNRLRAKPHHLIPRREFVARAGDADTPPVVETTRIRPARMWVTLVSPVLTETRRRWKIRINGVEYGAYIDDAGFVQSVLAGQAAVPMRANVELDVDINLHETLVGDDWRLDGHHVVTAVHGQRLPASAPGQLELP